MTPAGKNTAIQRWLSYGPARWVLALGLCLGGLSCASDDQDANELMAPEEPVTASDSSDTDGANAMHDEATGSLTGEESTVAAVEDKADQSTASVTESAAIPAEESPASMPSDPGSQGGDLEKALASLSNDESSTSPREAPTDSQVISDNTDAPAKAPKARRSARGAGKPSEKSQAQAAEISAADGPVDTTHARGVYVVEPGDSLAKIAQKVYGQVKPWAEIAEVNGITAPYVIFPGQVVRFHVSNDQSKTFSESYLKNRKSVAVQKGDSLSKIASKVFGNPDLWPRLYSFNRDKLRDPNILPAGITLTYLDQASDPKGEQKQAATTKAAPPTAEARPSTHAKPSSTVQTPGRNKGSKLRAKASKAKAKANPAVNVSPEDLSHH